MGTSCQKIRLFYYTRYRDLRQSIFALQCENFQPRPRVLQGFRVCLAQPPLNKTGTEICPPPGQISVLILPVQAGAHPSCGNRMDSYCMDRQGVQRGTAFPLARGFQRRAAPSLAHDFPSESLVCLYLCFAASVEQAGFVRTRTKSDWTIFLMINLYLFCQRY